MSSRVLMAAIATAALTFGFEPGSALANKMVYAVSGQVTSTPVGGRITVDGATYGIEPGSQAATEVAQVVVGETVQLLLDGPPASSSAQVVAIHETSGQ